MAKWSISLGIILLITACAPRAIEPELPGKSLISTSDLQTVAEEVCAATETPGLIIGVQQKEGEAVIAAAGVADAESDVVLEINAPFFIGSMSKNIFATITLMLVDEGRLSLDDKLVKYVDWPGGEDITIRMLLNHTSGIPDYFGLLYVNEGGDPVGRFKRQWETAELLNLVGGQDLVFQPGADQRYCNTNALLIGLIIEKVTRKALGEVLKEKICGPLNLKNTYLFGQATLQKKPVRGYQGELRWGEPGENGLVDCTYADLALLDVADGSIVSTAEDLLIYHLSLREGELLSKSSFDQMREQTPGFYNGLGYLLTNSKYGILEGNAGRTIGHQSAGYYHEGTNCYFVILGNRGDGPTPLGKALELLMPKLQKGKKP